MYVQSTYGYICVSYGGPGPDHSVCIVREYGVQYDTENCIDPCRHRDVPSVHTVEKWNTEED